MGAVKVWDQATNSWVIQGAGGGGAALPAGVVLDFAGTAAPAGYLLCDGSAVSRTTYADLYAAIGTTWGAGNGSTTFNLPDYRDRTLIGAGTQPLGQNDGLAAGSARVSSHTKDHTHSASTDSQGAHSHSGSTSTNGSHGHTASSAAAGGHSHTGSTDTGGAHTHAIPTAATQGYNAANAGGSVNRNAAATTDSGGSHAHNLNISTQADHSHGISVSSAGDHSHTVSTDSAGSHAHGVNVMNSGQGRDAYAVVTKIIKT